MSKLSHRLSCRVSSTCDMLVVDNFVDLYFLKLLPCHYDSENKKKTQHDCNFMKWHRTSTICLSCEYMHFWFYAIMYCIQTFLNCGWPSFKNQTGQLISVRIPMKLSLFVFYWNNFKSQKTCSREQIEHIFLLGDQIQYLSRGYIVYIQMCDYVRLCFQVCVSIYAYLCVCEPLVPRHYTYG
jgi:hypothetical protein